MQQAIKERRGAYRYPLRLCVEYRIFGRSHTIAAGNAEIVNMSSHGLLINTSEGVTKGQLIELSIVWRLYPDQPPVADLLILGRVIRSGPEGSAVKILRYGFYPRHDAPMDFTAMETVSPQ